MPLTLANNAKYLPCGFLLEDFIAICLRLRAILNPDYNNIGCLGRQADGHTNYPFFLFTEDFFIFKPDNKKKKGEGARSETECALNACRTPVLWYNQFFYNLTYHLWPKLPSLSLGMFTCRIGIIIPALLSGLLCCSRQELWKCFINHEVLPNLKLVASVSGFCDSLGVLSLTHVILSDCHHWS